MRQPGAAPKTSRLPPGPTKRRSDGRTTEAEKGSKQSKKERSTRNQEKSKKPQTKRRNERGIKERNKARPNKPNKMETRRKNKRKKSKLKTESKRKKTKNEQKNEQKKKQPRQSQRPEKTKKSKKFDDKAQPGQRRKRIERKRGQKAEFNAGKEKKAADRPRQGPERSERQEPIAARLFPTQSDKANRTTAAPKPSRRKLGAIPATAARGRRGLSPNNPILGRVMPDGAETRRSKPPRRVCRRQARQGGTFAFRIANQAGRKPHI